MKNTFYILMPDEERASYCIYVLLETGLKYDDLQVVSNRKHSISGLENANIYSYKQLIQGLFYGSFIGLILGFCLSVLLTVFPIPDNEFKLSELFYYNCLIGLFIGFIFALILYRRSPKSFYQRHSLKIISGHIMILITAPNHRVDMIKDLIIRIAADCPFGIVEE